MNEILWHRLLHRPTEANKYDFGHVLVVGGSPGMVGAPLLAGEAALRVGAGLVTIAAPAEVTNKLERRVREIMTLKVPQSAGEAVSVLQAFVDERRVAAVVMGPGMRPADGPLCRALVAALDRPVVLDAGGLLAFRRDLTALTKAHERGIEVVLTPHTGEYEKLTGGAVPTERARMQAVVTKFARQTGAVVVLKGYHTLVVGLDGSAHTNPTGNPGLATAGTGDVLAGVIAGLLAQGVAAPEAAEAGVYLHGLAGDVAKGRKTEAGMIASDVIEYLPDALRSLDSTPTEDYH